MYHSKKCSCQVGRVLVSRAYMRSLGSPVPTVGFTLNALCQALLVLVLTPLACLGPLHLLTPLRVPLLPPWAPCICSPAHLSDPGEGVPAWSTPVPPPGDTLLFVADVCHMPIVLTSRKALGSPGRSVFPATVQYPHTPM